MEWTDDQSETAVYGSWLESQKGKGRQGGARWPRARSPLAQSKKQTQKQLIQA